MAKKVVVLGDIVNSTKTPVRKELQHKLLYSCKRVNKIFASTLYAPFKITRGDEIAGILNNCQNVYKIVSRFRDLLYPSFLRFAVVYDELTVGLETKDASIITGPAFNLADNYLEEVKKKKYFIKFSIGKEHFDRIMTILADLINEIKEKWTFQQREAVSFYLKLNTQEQVAKKMGITQQYVAKLLKKSNFEKIQEAEKELEELLRIIQLNKV